ncbi:MAG: ABC transporter ATP-binding protein [Micavibrio sp.]|nr:ABC transporter ATP-binding protein [Micavibrio sp.]
MKVGHMKLLKKLKKEPLPENVCIRISNLSKGYRTKSGYHLVLDNISFDFPKDRNIGILGRNGAGKSTLLEIIFGRLFPDAGTIEFGQTKMSWPIGGSCLKASFNAKENIKFICRLYDVNIEEAIEFVRYYADLGKYFDEPVATYSSGMKARLIFALSAMIGFDCYLVDEGFNTGDERLTNIVHERFFGSEKKSNMIMVSHNPAHIRKFCDCAVVLDKGKFQYYDNIEDGITAYQNL